MIYCIARSFLIGLIGLPAALSAQDAPTEFSIGLHTGFDFTQGNVQQHRYGVQSYVGLTNILGIAGSVSFVPDLFNRPAVLSGYAWETFVTGRVRPFGVGTPLSLGYGLSYSGYSRRDLRRNIETSSTRHTDVAIISLELPSPFVRPFGELLLRDLLVRGFQVGANAHFGFNVRIR